MQERRPRWESPVETDHNLSKHLQDGSQGVFKALPSAALLPACRSACMIRGRPSSAATGSSPTDATFKQRDDMTGVPWAFVLHPKRCRSWHLPCGSAPCTWCQIDGVSSAAPAYEFALKAEVSHPYKRGRTPSSQNSTSDALQPRPVQDNPSSEASRSGIPPSSSRAPPSKQTSLHQQGLLKGEMISAT